MASKLVLYIGTHGKMMINITIRDGIDSHGALTNMQTPVCPFTNASGWRFHLKFHFVCFHLKDMIWPSVLHLSSYLNSAAYLRFDYSICDAETQPPPPIRAMVSKVSAKKSMPVVFELWKFHSAQVNIFERSVDTLSCAYNNTLDLTFKSFHQHVSYYISRSHATFVHSFKNRRASLPT